MAYQFDFLAVFDYTGTLVKGTALTLGLTTVGAVAGGAIGVTGAVCRAWQIRPFNRLFGLYVELIRNTPFLVQLLFVFFGLPSLGIQINAWQAAVLATVINLGAYSTEIIRAGILATPRGLMEAGASLAMTRLQVFRHVVLIPALQKIWPSLISQVVIVMLGSSVCSQISFEDLTYAANFILSRNFRSFETYIIVTAIYLVLAQLIRAALTRLGKRLFARRTQQEGA